LRVLLTAQAAFKASKALMIHWAALISASNCPSMNPEPWDALMDNAARDAYIARRFEAVRQ
jgi:hypothetical protein